MQNLDKDPEFGQKTAKQACDETKKWNFISLYKNINTLAIGRWTIDAEFGQKTVKQACDETKNETL